MPAMPTDRLAPDEARVAAGDLVRDLLARAPAALELDGVNLAPALEQQLFFALRDGFDPRPIRTPAVVRRAIDLGTVAGALGVAMVPRQLPDVGPDPIVAIIRQPARMSILAPIEAALEQLGGGSLAIARVARAVQSGPDGPRSVRLADLLDPRVMPGVARYVARLGASLASARNGRGSTFAGPHESMLDAIASRELPRIALGTAALESMVRRWHPSLLVAFDEVGTWSRIIPAVARARGVPSLNLPHAEAAVAVAIAGADYDRFAVFGPRAADVLQAAGIDPGRIIQIGAPHFDGLVLRPAPPAESMIAASPRRILVAAQYLQGLMTTAGLEACYRAALAAAAAVAPAEVVVVPHPLQPRGLIEGIVAGSADPPGVTVRVEHAQGLHALIDGAWLLVTGWSNSVFEAALRRVPSIMVDPEHVSPVSYAAEGLAIGVFTATAAADAARALLDPGFREATLGRAAAALTQHLGPLDGRSSERAAQLILSMSGRGGMPS
jgi:hypothetical protein